MIRKIKLAAYQKQLAELKSLQAVKDSVSLIIASLEPDGRIRAVITRGEPATGEQSVEFFNSEEELFTIPGFCETTVCLVDDFPQ